MPKIFLILSAVLLLASSGLSFINKNKLTASLTDAKGAHQQATTAQAETVKVRGDLKKSQQATQDANQAANDAKAAAEGLKSQVSDLTTRVTTADNNLKAKQDELDTLNRKIVEITGNLPKGDSSPDIAKQIDELKHQRDELQVVKDSLDSQLKTAQSQLAAASKREADVQSKAAMLGLRGRVLAVNREYNFVVLDLGSRNGVSGNATMIVQRGGSLVGKVRTVSVEPSQTVADILPNSVPVGVNVQPGDTVIFPGT